MTENEARESTELEAAALDLFMQAYGSVRHGSHGPTRMQWLRLGGALAAAGEKLPEDWDRVIADRRAKWLPRR